MYSVTEKMFIHGLKKKKKKPKRCATIYVINVVMLMEQAIHVYMAISTTYTIYALYQTDRDVHKLISWLSFSVVNKTVHKKRAAVVCVWKQL